MTISIYTHSVILVFQAIWLAPYLRLINIVIQHIDTLPKYGQKLSMYIGPHDVYPTMDVNFSILTRECKNKKIFSLQTLFCYQCVEL